MARIRKKYSPEFKLKAVLSVMKGDKTAAQLAGELGVHPMQLSEWKKHFSAVGAQIFENQKTVSKLNEEHKKEAELFEQIGRLKMEIEWLKKKLGSWN